MLQILFAIFGIIRYRTETIPIKEMTYLFVVVGLSVINALANKKISYAELLFANFAVVGLSYFFERIWNNTFIYFTYWGLIIQGLYYIGVLKKFQESVLVIVISVSVIGAILTYIYPRKIVVDHQVHLLD